VTDRVLTRVKAVICIYCGEVVVGDIEVMDGAAEAIRESFVKHDEGCTQNPIRTERERLRAERDLLRAAIALDAPALLEVLAEAEHTRWANWMRYQQTAPAEKRADWPRKAALAYWGMTNEEQESDRIEARKTLEIVRTYLRAAVDAFDKEG